MKLTPDEEFLLKRIERAKRRERLVSHLVYMVPVVLFGVFGVINLDAAALMVALGGALVFWLWSISNELKYAPMFQSIARKVLDSVGAHPSDTAPKDLNSKSRD